MECPVHKQHLSFIYSHCINALYYRAIKTPLRWQSYPRPSVVIVAADCTFHVSTLWDPTEPIIDSSDVGGPNSMLYGLNADSISRNLGPMRCLQRNDDGIHSAPSHRHHRRSPGQRTITIRCTLGYCYPSLRWCSGVAVSLLPGAIPVMLSPTISI